MLANQFEYPAEMAIHFLGRKNLDKRAFAVSASAPSGAEAL